MRRLSDGCDTAASAKLPTLKATKVSSNSIQTNRRLEMVNDKSTKNEICENLAKHIFPELQHFH